MLVTPPLLLPRVVHRHVQQGRHYAPKQHAQTVPAVVNCTVF